MTPVNSPSFPILHLTQENQECDIKTDLILGTPLNSPQNLSSDFMFMKDLCARSVHLPCQKVGKTEISPLVHWTPDWEEYGSYIISPQNLDTQKYVQSLPGERGTDMDNSICVHVDNTGLGAKTKDQTVCGFLHTNSTDSSPLINCSESDPESCEFEIIAEFSKSEFTPDLDLGICS